MKLYAIKRTVFSKCISVLSKDGFLLLPIRKCGVIRLAAYNKIPSGSKPMVAWGSTKRKHPVLKWVTNGLPEQSHFQYITYRIVRRYKAGLTAISVNARPVGKWARGVV